MTKQREPELPAKMPYRHPVVPRDRDENAPPGQAWPAFGKHERRARLMETVLLASTACLLAAVAWPIATGGGGAANDQLPSPTRPAIAPPVELQTPQPATRIQIALLLDTSSSMDGLIDQARTQLWGLVNALAETQLDGRLPQLEIALYEYGNSGLSQDDGWIRKVRGFTGELDQVSESLFSLATNGGDEHAGQAIERALDELQWRSHPNDMRIIYIAGNESFHQGPVSLQHAMDKAKAKGVLVNTIFCGPREEGRQSGWELAATTGGGRYLNIDHNYVQQYVAAPQDDEIAELGRAINETYVHYGAAGSAGRQMQEKQDRNVAGYGKGSAVKRALSKSSALYRNGSWDLVDALEEGEVSLDQVDAETLPAQLQGKDKREIAEHVAAKKKERNALKSKLAKLAEEREAWLAQHNESDAAPSSLDQAMLEAIEAQAAASGVRIDKK